jgi:hypothetical protein
VDFTEKKEKEGEERPGLGSFGLKMDMYAKKMAKVGLLSVCLTKISDRGKVAPFIAFENYLVLCCL